MAGSDATWTEMSMHPCAAVCVHHVFLDMDSSGRILNPAHQYQELPCVILATNADSA